MPPRMRRRSHDPTSHWSPAGCGAALLLPDLLPAHLFAPEPGVWGSRQHGGLSDSRSGVYFGVHRLLAADAPVRCLRTAGAVPPPGQGVLHPLRVGSAAGTGWFHSQHRAECFGVSHFGGLSRGRRTDHSGSHHAGLCLWSLFGDRSSQPDGPAGGSGFRSGAGCGSGRNRWRDPAGLFCPGWHGGCSPGAGAVFPGPMPQHRGAAVPAPGRKNPGHRPGGLCPGGAGVDGLLPDQHPAGDSGAGTLCLCAKLPHLLDAGGSRTLGGHTAGHHQPVAFVRGSAYLYGMVGCVRRLVPRLSRVQAVLWVGLGMAALAWYLCGSLERGLGLWELWSGAIPLLLTLAVVLASTGAARAAGKGEKSCENG